MHPHGRAVIMAGLLASVTGCGSHLGPVMARQSSGSVGHPNLPDITVQRAKECMAEYGLQLDPGLHSFKSNVEVNEDGDKEDVTIEGLPDSAPDLGACLRNALRDMPIAEEPFRQSVKELNFRREHPTAEQRSLMGSPVIVVAGVVIIVSEIVLEAGAYTILFAVTVKVVDKAKDDVMEALKRRPPITDGEDDKECVDGYERCILSGGGGTRGNHLGTSSCETCLRVCQNKGGWPSSIPVGGRMVSCF